MVPSERYYGYGLELSEVGLARLCVEGPLGLQSARLGSPRSRDFSVADVRLLSLSRVVVCLVPQPASRETRHHRRGFLLPQVPIVALAWSGQRIVDPYWANRYCAVAPICPSLTAELDPRISSIFLTATGVVFQVKRASAWLGEVPREDVL
jgi:hypothetical protein